MLHISEEAPKVQETTVPLGDNCAAVYQYLNFEVLI